MYQAMSDTQGHDERFTCGRATKEFFKKHWVDILIIVILAAGSYGANQVQPYNRFFLEQDPTLSYPYYSSELAKSYPETGRETVPNWLLPVLIAIPATLYIITHLICRFCFRKAFRDRTSTADQVLDVPLAAITFLQTIILTICATETFAGRKRPNFFALCDYADYREFLKGNRTYYLANTVAGNFGNLSKCGASVGEIRESQLSFPSGHASLSFSSLGVTGMLFFQLAQARFHSNRFLQGGLVLILTSGAALIATTRTRDYWHNFDDVLAGSLIGMSSAIFVFGVHYYHVVLTLRREQDSQDSQYLHRDKDLLQPP